MRGEGEVFFSEKGSDFFGEAVKDQSKGKTLRACEGADVFWIGWEGDVGIQMSVTVVDGSH